jgi:hypothetical protein
VNLEGQAVLGSRYREPVPQSFQAAERARLAALAAERWSVPGHVVPYAYADQVLHEDVRTSALRYFADHEIK